MNTRSSTECEQVGTSEYLPKNIYFEIFMEGQGYKLKSNLLCKDNESEIKLIKNGANSCTWNSRHVAIKHFWVTDRIHNGNIQVQYCPTKQMVVDYFSIPIQASLFHIFRGVIMGWTHLSHVFEGYISPEERVEKKARDTNSNLVEWKKSYASAVENQNLKVQEEIEAI